MINRVILVGRLTRDPETRTTQTGKNVASFSIAVDKKFKPQDGSATADFFRVTAWGATADFVGNYLTKGRLVAVDGRLETRKFTDKEGREREVVDVVADSVQGLDRPKDDAGGGSGGGGGSYSDRGAYAGGGSRGGSDVAVPKAEEYDPFADE